MGGTGKIVHELEKLMKETGIEIKKNALEAILLSSNIELHKVIQQMSKELGKDSDHKLPITQKDLKDLVKKSPDVIRALALQLHYRLSQRIFH